ncbi:MAG: hypothetical protein CEE38_06000 [Planctomycetes bacterium B3_Pla]|nr:MAG: hypothetical protein CEE38_06000 [Planctomycetes bacterium B3_Pla]
MCERSAYLTFFVLVFCLTVGVVHADLRHHWRFDGDLDDRVGSLDLTSTGDGPVFTVGKHGGAVEFDGGADYIYAELAVFMPSQTTCVWVRTSSSSQSILGWSGGHPTDGLHDRELYVNSDGTVTVRVWTGTATTVTSQTPVDDGVWHHLATGYTEGGETWLYVDGVSQGSTPSSGIYNSYPTSYLTVGIESNVNSYFTGAVDDVRVYDEALTEGQVLGAMVGGAFPFAFGPVPKDGAMLADTWVTLGWSPGDFVVSHDVYLGDNPDDVNNGTPGAPGFRGNQASTMFIVGFPGFPYPDGLVPGTTYYWRIDEVNDTEPNSPWRGDVWSFSIPPKTAYNPDPADGAEFVDPNATFNWTPGFGAKLHTAYMGANFDDVNNAAGGLPLGSASYSPPALESEKVYYWRVDEFDAFETHKGDIWSFTTPGAVGNPQPANGATDVQMISTLSWTPADNASSHELYFGADADAVKNATTASPEYVGSKALGAESYDPGGLAWDSSYAWRVDEVYPAETVKGLVWSFSTADFILVDDFESYNDIDPPDPNSNRIFDKWIDGFGTTDNGALVGNDLPPYAEQTIVHGGAQSMIYRYDNANKTSEATMALVYPYDWSDQGVTKLSLWFRGSSTNSAEQMYVALNGNAVVYHAEAAPTQSSGWAEWVIDLAAFAGVDLTNVNSITLGFGTKNSPSPTGGTGTMYFDDARLVR